MNSISVCKYGVLKWADTPRMYILPIFISLHLISVLYLINSFATEYNINSSMYIFPFITADRFTFTVIMLGFIILFCDAPFLDNAQQFIIIRSGRRSFLYGKILYIIFTSIVYTIFLIITTISCVLPTLKMSDSWGKLMGTFARTSADIQYGIDGFFVSNYVVTNYTPIMAMVHSVILFVLAGVFTGLLIFLLNMYFNRIVGVVTATAFVLFAVFCRDFFIVNFFIFHLYLGLIYHLLILMAHQAFLRLCMLI